MIKTFKSKEAAKIYNEEYSRKLSKDIQRTALRKLLMINNAVNLNDLKIPPANRLEKLKKDKLGQYSIRINRQWRICFIWENGNAYDIEIVDYH
ncbi:type II toxin-antitoxin system RelE/ParE family toxin [Candidatus Peregrinibacteria bacterium]|nr:type II toxin-antitoxin system RelE/ParE family toxin [Candidatus Peregrinibacteria bacterium]